MSAELENNAGTETILVVDDERMLRDMLSGFLSDYGYTVLLAADGQEALELYHSHRDTIHLIVMDIVMPRKDGVSAYKEIKNLNPRTKIILMSGYNAHNLHVPEHLKIVRKPFSFHDMARTIRTTLDTVHAEA
jgi:CheY-like chemotaxis protein